MVSKKTGIKWSIWSIDQNKIKKVAQKCWFFSIRRKPLTNKFKQAFNFLLRFKLAVFVLLFDEWRILFCGVIEFFYEWICFSTNLRVEKDFGFVKKIFSPNYFWLLPAYFSEPVFPGAKIEGRTITCRIPASKLAHPVAGNQSNFTQSPFLFCEPYDMVGEPNDRIPALSPSDIVIVALKLKL